MPIATIPRLLALLTVANGAPVIAKKISGNRFGIPVDFGCGFFDGRPLFGPSKTIRGIAASILSTAAAAPLVGLNWTVGASLAATAMAGDLFSSFMKRRLNLPPSSQALGFDQIPESLLPMLILRRPLGLTAVDLAAGVGIFFAGELLLSRILFRIHLRDEPY